jgi:SAM-dependent methyltransferase
VSGKLKTLLRRFYRAVTVPTGEACALARLARIAFSEGSGGKVLDVGCGYGRNTKLLMASGFDVLGVDVNETIVNANRAAGLRCMTVAEFLRSDETFDLVLMSHVIEHFAPADLVGFIDVYLDRLRPSGHLLIATPLFSSNFFDDFDHVRPYQPIGLLMVFGRDQAQVQYYARNQIELRDIWFRRSPWRGNFVRARYMASPLTRFLQLAEFASAIVFRASFGLFGRTDGWVGLFRKLS